MYTFQVNAWKRVALVLALLVGAVTGRTQIYPVQVSTQVSPPYSVYLPDYASPGGEKLRVVLLQRDLTQQGYRLRFELKIQINGVTIMQTARSAMPPPIILQPGVPTVLGGTELSWYVQPQNLEFGGGYNIGAYEQSRSLPEGPVTLTFTAFDYNRGDVQVSEASSSFFYVTRDNPPLLNYPACGMQVRAINPQFVTFSWLPQNMSSPNSALQTNYIFSLWAIQPAGYNYQDIVQNSRPLYSVTTQQPNLVYGPGEPLLTPGWSYAWRVQAVDITGRDVFRNNGFSETCNFIYTGDSSQGILEFPPIQINAASAGSAQGKMWWTAAGGSSLHAAGYDQYRLYYRKAEGNYDWFSSDVNDTMYRAFDLEPSTTYECRLQGIKSGSLGPYTDIVRFATDLAKSVSCTQSSSMLAPYSGRPLAFATGGMSVTYGPWDVQLLTVQPLSSPGRFKGTCKVTVPFMAGMTFNAKFDDLSIDDSRNVNGGNIEFLTQGIKAWMDSSIKNQMGGSLYGSVVGGGDTTNVTVNISLANLDHLDVTLKDDSTIQNFTLPGDPPVVVLVNDGMVEVTIKDANGSTYSLDNQGKLTQLTLSDGSLQDFFADAQNVAGLNMLASGVGTVTFKNVPDAKYAFDEWKPFYSQATTVMTGQYEKLAGPNGDYYVPQKAIGAGQSDIIGLDIDLPDNMDEDSLIFATAKGIRLIWDPNDYTLNLLGGPAADAQEIYALYPKPGGGYYSLAKLLVSAYEHKDFTAVLVPVAAGNEAAPQVDPQQFEDALNKIYNKVNISWKVELDPAYNNTGWDADGDGLLTMTGSSFLSNKLTGEPAALIKGYKSSVSVDASKRYIFILNTSSGSTGEASGLMGDMPRATQYGFIFLKASSDAGEVPGVSLAHELGHGQFNLEHTFSGDIGLTQGATKTYPNLMDYVGGEKNLYKYQWNQVHQPGEVIGIIESDAAGKITGAITDMFQKFANKDGSFTFVTPSGKYITLPNNIGGVYFSTYDKVVGKNNIYRPPVGSLIGFNYNSKYYTAVYSGTNFIGYEYNSGSVANHYNETLSFTNQPAKGIVLFTAVENNSFVDYIGQFASPTAGAPMSPNDGFGPISTSAIITGASVNQLSQNYATYLQGVFGNDMIRIPDNTNTWVQPPYDVLLDNASNLTAAGYLKAALNTNSSLGDVLAQYVLVFDGSSAIDLFKNCQGMVTLDQIREVTAAFHIKMNTVQEKLTPGTVDQTATDNLGVQLQNTALEAAQQLDASSQVALKVSTAQSLSDVYNAVTKNYNECTFLNLDLNTRMSILQWMFGVTSNSQWYYHDSNVVYKVLRTAPAGQQVALLKGFMNTNYSWLQSLWHTGTLGYCTPVINLLSSWVLTYNSQLNIPITTVPLTFNDVAGYGLINDPGAGRPFVIGLSDNSTADIGSLYLHFIVGNGGEGGVAGITDDAGDASFSSAGKITFTQRYALEDRYPVIVPAGTTPDYPRTHIDYQQSFDPFEPVSLLFVQSYDQIQVTGGTSYVVPAIFAYWAFQAQSNDFQGLTDQITSADYIRVVINGTAILGAAFTGGESVGVGSIIREMVVAAAGADAALHEAELNHVISASQIPALGAWREYYNAVMVADGVNNLLKGGADLPGVASRWNEFDSKAMELGSALDPTLQAAWNSVKTLTPVSAVSINNILFNDLKALDGLKAVGNVIEDAGGVQIAHLTSDGLLHFDIASGSITEDAIIVDIEQNQKFVLQNGSSVTDDVVISKNSSGYVCTLGACFASGTPISTSKGIRSIEQVKMGDSVLSLDIRSGAMKYEKVTALFKHTVSRLVRLIIGKDTIYSTPEHPYYTEFGWKSASAVKAGWKLRIAGGLLATAISSASIDTAATVYNFTVDQTHTYCVGRQGIVVHNSCVVLARLKSKVDPSLFGEFASDFGNDANMLTAFDNGTYSIDAWEVGISRPALRKTPAFLQDVTNCLKRSSLQKLGLDKTALQQVTEALLNDYKGFPTAAKELEAGIFKTLSNFGAFMDANPGTTLKNFGKLVSDLTGGRLPARKGTAWILKYISENSAVFGGETITFNVTIGGDGVSYYADVRLDVDPPIFMEFKSGDNTIVKQTEFIREFVARDLANEDLKSPGKLKWLKDVPDGTLLQRITGYLKSDEGIAALNALDPARKKLFFPNYIQDKGITGGDIDAFLSKNYSIIFKLPK